MARNKVVKVIGPGQTWICPAGVTFVQAFAQSTNNTISNCETHMAAIDTTGVMYTWGSNSFGELGQNFNPTVRNQNSTPAAVVGGRTWKWVSTGESTTGGVNVSDQNIYMWGQNTNGQLGDGTQLDRSSPVAVLGGHTFRTVTAGPANTFGIDTNGNGWSWGANGAGQLGDGTTVAKSSPVAIVGGLKFVKISVDGASTSHGLGLTTTGDIYAWGLNTNGQLGQGNTTNRSSPVLVIGGLKFRDIAVGNACSFGLGVDGNLYSWGLNGLGQLGLGDTTNRSSPVKVIGGLKFKAVRANGSSTLGLQASNGNAWVWGFNVQYYAGQPSDRNSSPVAVVGSNNFKDASIGNTVIEGLRSDGTILTWGFNSLGDFGNGATGGQSSTPTAIFGGNIYSETDVITQNIFNTTPGNSYAAAFGTTVVTFGDQSIVASNAQYLVIVYEA